MKIDIQNSIIMNKLYIPVCIIVTALLSFLSVTTRSQWIQQSSGTTNQLYDVCVVDSNTVYTVGANGTIVKTSDGGNNWLIQASGTSSLSLSMFLGMRRPRSGREKV